MFVFADGYSLFGATAGLFLMPVQAFVVIGTAYEFLAMIRRRYPISMRSSLVAVTTAFLASFVPILYSAFTGKPYPSDCPIGLVGWSSVGVVAALFILTFDAFRYYRATQSDAALRLAFSFLIVTYCSVLSHFLVCIRLSPANYDGLIIMVGFIITVKMSDAGAYFSGRLIGKHPLDPVISPKKTIEGAVGGILISAAVASLFFFYFKHNVFGCNIAAADKLPLWGPAAAGSLIATAGLFGDLLESVIKRACAVKDSGSLLPGLGGIWDVTDSLFFAAPVGYMAVLAGWLA